MSYESINPTTGKVLKKFKGITNKQLESSVKTAATKSVLRWNGLNSPTRNPGRARLE